MRLFLGMEIFAPWPEEFPPGRVLLEPDRHLTLAFLGDTSLPDFGAIPKPSFSIGLAGIFDKPLFLSHVAAWHIHWLEEGIVSYQNQLAKTFGIQNDFLSHVTIAREPYDKRAWKESFRPLPCFVKNINLYESLGHSKYKILWQYSLQAPFDEIEHTADIAFNIRGDLFLHAQLALAFHFPPMIRYFDERKIAELEEIVRVLNEMIARADSEIGCPFKAVSFHGIHHQTNEWEMIVDV